MYYPFRTTPTVRVGVVTMGKRRASLDLVRAAAAVALLGLVVAASSAAEVLPPADEGTAEEGT